MSDAVKFKVEGEAPMVCITSGCGRPAAFVIVGFPAKAAFDPKEVYILQVCGECKVSIKPAADIARLPVPAPAVDLGKVYKSGERLGEQLGTLIACIVKAVKS